MLSGIQTFVFRYILLILVGYIASRSPLLMKTSAPSGIRPWADGPIDLIATPQHETGKTDLFTTGATHMCLLHNSILRGYNSIYHQADHIRDSDKADFVGYCQTWHKFVLSHHDDEEAVLFPMIEEILADKDVWAETLKEHESMLHGLTEFHNYLASLPSPAAFSGERLLGIMATFQEPFVHHFRSEVSFIASLADHPRCPAEGTAEADAARARFAAWGKSTVSKAGVADVVPFFLMNLDSSFEGGMWAGWPPMPKPIRWGLVNLAGAWRGGWWRFGSCDGAGGRRELYALEKEGKVQQQQQQQKQPKEEL